MTEAWLSYVNLGHTLRQRLATTSPPLSAFTTCGTRPHDFFANPTPKRNEERLSSAQHVCSDRSRHAALTL
jgi:hypothetical protein